MDINNAHKNAMNIAATTDQAVVDRVRNCLDHLLETGASFLEAKTELQRQFGHSLADLQGQTLMGYQQPR